MATAIIIFLFGLMLFALFLVVCSKYLKNEKYKEHSQFGSILVPKGRNKG